MKFLVTTKDGPGLPPGEEKLNILETLVLPAFDQIIELEKSGKIVGGIPAGSRAFAFVMEAESSDEVDRCLHSLLNWGVLEWLVTPLQSFQGRAALPAVALRLKTCGGSGEGGEALP